MADHSDHITALLKHVLAIPVLVNDGDFRLAQGLGRYRLEPGEYSVFNYLKKVFGWLPLNPSKPSYRDAIRETYVPEAFDTVSATLPSAAGFEQLYRDVLNPDVKCIYITGVKGCGKTAALNYFINEYHQRLNTANMTWFRSDISKIYASLIQPDRTKEITLYEYQQAHTLFVALKYADTDPLLKPFELQHGDPDPTRCTFYAEILRPLHDGAVEKIWSEVVATFMAHTDTPLQFVNSVIFTIKRFGEGAFDRLVARVTTAIRRGPDGSTRRIIQILDSVDNIDKKSDEERYGRFLRQLSTYAGVQHKANPLYDKTIIVLRRETLIDLEKIDPAVRITEGSARTEEFRVEPVRPAPLFHRKCQVAESPTSEFLIKGKQQYISAPGYEPIWERTLSALTDVYFEELGSDVRRHNESNGAGRHTSAGVDEDVLRALFNLDLRTLSHNLLNTTRYLRAYISALQWRRPTTDLHHMLHQVMQHRRYLLLEGSITGGQPFMPMDNRSDKARWCPNLFFFELSTETSQWMGLALLRILQALSDRKKINVTEQAIIDRLGAELSYPASDLKLALASAWSFGLIEPHDVLRTPTGMADTLRLTDKGRFLMRTPFSNPAVTYFMGASTRLHQSTLEDSKTFQLHDPTGSGPRQFPSACIKTGLTLLRHARAQHEHDMRTCPAASAGLFQLPGQDEWLGRATGYCMGLYKENRLAYETLISDLKGIAT